MLDHARRLAEQLVYRRARADPGADVNGNGGLMDFSDLCNRCLIIINATTVVMARGPGELVQCDYPTNALALASWARDMLYVNGWTIDVNDRSHMFRPVSTWNGDPVCATHLYFLVDAERKWQTRR